MNESGDNLPATVARRRRSFVSRFGILQFGVPIGLVVGLQQLSRARNVEILSIEMLRKVPTLDFLLVVLLPAALGGLLGGYLFGALMWALGFGRRER